MSQYIIRSPFKNKEYFDTTVTYNEETLKRFKRKLAAEEISTQHRRRLSYSVYMRSFEQIIVRYSKGDPVGDIALSFREAILSLEYYLTQEGAEPDDFSYLGQYVTSIWMLSLAVLLEIDNDLFQKLVHLLGNERRDLIFEHLVGSRPTGQQIDFSVLHVTQYGSLAAVFSADDDKKPHLIKAFLDGYYEGMSEVAWHGTHLRSDTSFFGYWSFEAAAVVKTLQIPDSLFREHMHYPRDFLQPISS